MSNATPEMQPLAVWNPTRGIWEKPQLDLFARQEQFWETWPTCGMTRNGWAYPLPQSAHPTPDTASSSSPTALFRTPLASDASRGGESLPPKVFTIDGKLERFRGEVLSYEPSVEITFEQMWIGSDDEGPAQVTIRLTALDGGTLVELFHHGYERLGGSIADHLAGYEDGWTVRQVHALRDLVAA